VHHDSGKIRIKHRWRYTKPCWGLMPGAGKRVDSIDEFSDTTDGRWLRPKLDAVLMEIGKYLCGPADKRCA
jgi:hypothetical protein